MCGRIMSKSTLKYIGASSATVKKRRACPDFFWAFICVSKASNTHKMIVFINWNIPNLFFF